MKERRLPIMPTLRAAYRDWRRLLLPLRTIVISAFLILLAISVVAEFVPHRWWDQELSGEALGLLQDAVWALLLTPIVIALHRFVILGEVTPGYEFDVGDPAFRLFFIWLFGLKVFSGLPYTLLGVLQALGFSPKATAIPFAVALIVVIAVSLRLTILIPAIAVEAPSATARHAFADTKGQALRILAVFLLALVPWIAAVIAITILLGPGTRVTGSVLAMVGLVVGAIAQTAVVSLSTVVASHAFMFLAAQVKRAAAL
ncbi:MAG TPA: hypothetical protein VGF53_16735 [Pseudolabrys sp.]